MRSALPLHGFLALGLIATLFFGSASAAQQATQAPVPPLMRFSGTLPGSEGAAVVTFSLYAEASGGVALWSERQVVNFDGLGHYSIVLGSASSEGLPVALFAAGLWIVLVSLVMMGGLYVFVNKTRVGTAIRAAAIVQAAARHMGIDVNRVILIVFLIGPALGGAAGLLVGLQYGQINFTMGWTYGMKAFTAAILGGIGNIPGAMLGGLILGVIEALGSAYISIAWKDAIAFFVLILILIVRPTGLLGERVADKI